MKLKTSRKFISIKLSTLRKGVFLMAVMAGKKRRDQFVEKYKKENREGWGKWEGDN